MPIITKCGLRYTITLGPNIELISRALTITMVKISY